MSPTTESPKPIAVTHYGHVVGLLSTKGATTGGFTRPDAPRPLFGKAVYVFEGSQPSHGPAVDRPRHDLTIAPRKVLDLTGLIPAGVANELIYESARYFSRNIPANKRGYGAVRARNYKAVDGEELFWSLKGGHLLSCVPVEEIALNLGYDAIRYRTNEYGGIPDHDAELKYVAIAVLSDEAIQRG